MFGWAHLKQPRLQPRLMIKPHVSSKGQRPNSTSQSVFKAALSFVTYQQPPQHNRPLPPHHGLQILHHINL
ncbi:hypothetical protein HanIR_Chr04g0205561 [Helianthus annuus]|nr:hypothetical protein HanIR_Chr04g0205561 [Helianthus annuus]